MEELEKKNRKRQKIGTLEKAILGTIATAGILSVAMVAPNIFQFLPRKRNKSRFTYQTKTALSRLIKKGLVKLANKDSANRVCITKKGELVLNKIDRGVLLKKPKKWDKLWRVVIFDIPEYKKAMRDKLRITMRALGFLKLQDSVWIYPYDCEEIVSLLRIDLQVGREVIYMIVNSIENDKSIRSSFNLPVE